MHARDYSQSFHAVQFVSDLLHQWDGDSARSVESKRPSFLSQFDGILLLYLAKPSKELWEELSFLLLYLPNVCQEFEGFYGWSTKQ